MSSFASRPRTDRGAEALWLGRSGTRSPRAAGRTSSEFKSKVPGGEQCWLRSVRSRLQFRPQLGGSPLNASASNHLRQCHAGTRGCDSRNSCCGGSDIARRRWRYGPVTGLRLRHRHVQTHGPRSNSRWSSTPSRPQICAYVPHRSELVYRRCAGTCTVAVSRWSARYQCVRAYKMLLACVLKKARHCGFRFFPVHAVPTWPRGVASACCCALPGHLPSRGGMFVGVSGQIPRHALCTCIGMRAAPAENL